RGDRGPRRLPDPMVRQPRRGARLASRPLAHARLREEDMPMSPTTLFAVQFTLSTVLFSLVARWYVSPALDRLPLGSALAPLFLVQALRYLPSSAFAPGQVGASVPMNAMSRIAWGDLGAAILALAAALFLRYRWPGAVAVAWVVNVVTSLDWLYG